MISRAFLPRVFKPLFCAPFSIYTKTGDKGTSCLYTGERLPKTAVFFNVVGTVDELNSNVGHAIAHCQERKLFRDQIVQLQEVQNRLFDIGSHVATPRKSADEKKVKYTQFSAQHTRNLEKWIDEMTLELPPLTGFILPSGGVIATSLHVCRSVCRRCERLMADLLIQGMIDQDPYQYVNRLSDYFFTCLLYTSDAADE
eukprot:TRINITY_DN10240_c0_g1_i4.p1 TRINITY_DN10240_c0_g1~~TRINITY_DN10240_c0_g1_i4.p1  ORF type:complete len:199 (+),score=55.95 TRINITY_DN10240_c0_g1_i4:130-726(+)